MLSDAQQDHSVCRWWRTYIYYYYYYLWTGIIKHIETTINYIKAAAVCSWQRQYFISHVHCCDLEKSLSRRSIVARSEHGRDTTLYVRSSLVGHSFNMITRHKTDRTRWPITRNRNTFQQGTDKVVIPYKINSSSQARLCEKVGQQYS
jgi:hypothetical protein